MPPIVHLREILAATPRAVFDAWSTPGLMSKWLFKSPDNQITINSQELYIGGRFSIMETTAENEKIDHFGNYLVIVPETLLSFTLEVPWHFRGVTVVTVNFTADASGNCVMGFQQSGIEPQIVEANWKTMFMQLKKVVSRR